MASPEGGDGSAESRRAWSVSFARRPGRGARRMRTGSALIPQFESDDWGLVAATMGDATDQPELRGDDEATCEEVLPAGTHGIVSAVQNPGASERSTSPGTKPLPGSWLALHARFPQSLLPANCALRQRCCEKGSSPPDGLSAPGDDTEKEPWRSQQARCANSRTASIRNNLSVPSNLKPQPPPLLDSEPLD